MIGEQWIRKDLDGSGRDVIEVLSQNLFEGTEENYERAQS
jgi:hypothetical protein